jgi:hypothetical protein
MDGTLRTTHALPLMALLIEALAGAQAAIAAPAPCLSLTHEGNVALFLDGGSVPSLYVPAGRPGNVFAVGPMIAVFEAGR